MKYGYARVSTKEQNEVRQLLALADHGIERRNIFIDKQSGKNFERSAYQMMTRTVSPGDVLVIESIDRLGRNYSEILEQWRMLTKEIGISIIVLDMPILDTRSEKGRTFQCIRSLDGKNVDIA